MIHVILTYALCFALALLAAAVTFVVLYIVTMPWARKGESTP